MEHAVRKRTDGDRRREGGAEATAREWSRAKEDNELGAYWNQQSNEGIDFYGHARCSPLETSIRKDSLASHKTGIDRRERQF